MLATIAYDPQLLSDRPEEELLRLAQAGTCPQAVAALVARYLGDLRALVARMAHAAHLPPDDADEALQEVLLLVPRAIRRYDLARLAGPRPCRLRTFLHRVAGHVFRNVLDRRGRAAVRERRVRQAAAQALDGSTPSRAVDWMACSPDWREEPSLIAQEREARADLARGVADLDAEQRCLWEAVCAGTRLAVLARRLGRPPSTVRRDLQRVVALLGARVRGHRN